MIDQQRPWYRVEGSEIQTYHRREILAPELPDTRLVLPKTYTLVGGRHGRRYAATFGAGPCMIVSLHSSITQQGALTHFTPIDDIGTTLSSLETRVSQPHPHLPGLTMRILGGRPHDDIAETTRMLLKVHAGANQIQIVEEDLFEIPDRRAQVSVVLDSKTGSLHDLSLSTILGMSPRTNEICRLQNDRTAALTRLGDFKIDPLIIDLP